MGQKKVFQGQAVRGKILLTDILITSWNGGRKIMQPVIITNAHASKKRNQFSQFR